MKLSKIKWVLPFLPLAIVLPFTVNVEAPAIADTVGITASTTVFTPLSYSPESSWGKYSANPVVPKGPLGTWDAGGVAAKSVVKSGDAYYMYYQGDDGTGKIDIGLATSTDLLNWTKSPQNPIVTKGKPGEWDSFWVGMPAVVAEDNDWKMLYEGSDGINSRLGLAVSSDGIHWSKYPANPVLNINTPGTWDDTYVGTPTIVPDGGGYKVYYVAATFPPHGEIGLASTPDLIHFTRESPAPLMQRDADGGFASYEITCSAVEVFDGSYLMWLCGYDGKTWAIGCASSADGKVFTQRDENPFFRPQGTDWDSLSVQLPIVIREDDAAYMFYAGANSGYQEGVAISTSN